MCPTGVGLFSLTFLGDLGQFLDLGNLRLAFLGVEMLGPHTPIVLVHRIPRVFRYTIIVLNSIGNQEKHPMTERSAHQCQIERASATHLASKEASSQNRPYGGTMRVVFIKRTV